MNGIWARANVSGVTIEFEGTVRRVGERLLVQLPDAVSVALPSRGQVAVEAKVNGRGFMTVLEPDGRKGHWISVDDELRETLSLTEGDALSGKLTPTKAWPEPDLPEDLESALAQAPDLDSAWRDITPMARWEWVRWVGATKNPKTRERRVEVTISKLRGGSRRPCCFDLSSCTDPEVATGGKLIDAD